MQDETDFVGHINIEPFLSEAEQEYLVAFAASRRFARDGGPYDVPGNPAAERREHVKSPPPGHRETAMGQPNMSCRWKPCLDGCCLGYDGYGESFSAARWLAYLIDHFLCPGAMARTSGSPWLAGFSFDHRLDGFVVGCRRRDKELFVVRVEDNVVWEEIVVPGDPRFRDPIWPDHELADRWQQERRRRRAARP